MLHAEPRARKRADSADSAGSAAGVRSDGPTSASTTPMDARELSLPAEAPPPRADTYRGVAAFFDAFAPVDHVWRQRNRTYHTLLEQLFRFQVPEGSSVLEIGSGSGDLLAALKPAHGVGIDVS